MVGGWVGWWVGGWVGGLGGWGENYEPLSKDVAEKIIELQTPKAIEAPAAKAAKATRLLTLLTLVGWYRCCRC